MPRHDGRANLTPFNSERARAQAKKGAKASVKARRKKKLLSMIYGDLLADQSGIRGGRGFEAVAADILNSTDKPGRAARIALLKEIREATEGSKVKTETVLTVNTDDKNVQQVLKEFGIVKPETED